MFIDSLNQYSKAQALSATGVSTNSLDHGLDRDIGIGEPMAVVFTVDVALAGTTPSVIATVQASPNSNMSSPVNVVSSQTFTTLAAGARFVLVLPPDGTFDRYSQINYTLAGTTPTVTLTANLIPLRFVQADQYGPSGINVQ